MLLRKIDATVIFVQDLETCAAFYRDVIGLPVAVTDPVSIIFQLEDQQHLVLLKPEAAGAMMSEEAIAFQQANGHRMLLCVGVEDVDSVYATLTSKGVIFIKPPVDQVWGRRTAYFADPEGNLWELWQSLPAEQGA